MQPPFPAPPEERNAAKLTLGLLIAGAVVVVCLVGCVAGFAGFAVWQLNETNEGAKATVTRFLDALRDSDDNRAAAEVCPQTDSERLIDGFTDGFPADLDSFTVDDLGSGLNKLVVPATLHFADGTSRSANFTISQEVPEGRGAQRIRYHVCGVDWS